MDLMSGYKVLKTFPSATKYLKTIVSFGKVTPEQKEEVEKFGLAIYAWDEFLLLGDDRQYDLPVKKKSDICTIMYTSGTTGDPKGILISNNSIVTLIAGVRCLLGSVHELLTEKDVYLSYLPLAHIFDRVIEECFINIGGSIGFWRGDVKLLTEDIGELKPTIFCAVPRVLDRIYAGLQQKISSGGLLKNTMFNFAYSYKLHNMKKGSKHVDAAPLCDKIVFNKKNIFKLSQGEYVAVENLENVYGSVTGIDSIWVYGNSFESFLVAVVNPNKQVLERWAEENGVPGDFNSLCENPKAKQNVLVELTRIGKEKNLKGFEFIKAVHLDPEPFDMERDLLTPTFKKKRPQLLKYYQNIVDNMYKGAKYILEVVLNNPKLCMNAVCALYRQQLRKGQSVNGSSLTKNQGFTVFDLMSMDGVGDELATIDAVDNTLFQSKDGEYSRKANMLNESIAIVSTLSNRDAIISNAWEDVGYTVFPKLLGPKPPDDVHNDNVEHVLNNESKAVASNPLAPPGGPAREGFGAVIRGQTDSKASSTAMVAFNAPLCSSSKTVVPLSHDVARPGLGPSLNAFHDGIVGLVDISHAKGVALQDLRPSCFKLLPSNQVIYLGSCVRHETAENSIDQDSLLSENDRNEKRPLEQAMHPAVSERIKKQKFGENLNFIRQWHQFPSRSSFKIATANDTDVGIAGPKDSWNELNKEHNLRREYKSESNYSRLTPQLRSTYASDPLEEKKWYTSPEELSGKGCTFSSNIYILGVLLFESDVISGVEESFGDKLSSSIDQDDAESELLLHFFFPLEEQKQKDTLKLVEEIKYLEADIEEVQRRQTKKSLVLACLSKESLHPRGNGFCHREHSSFEVHYPIANNELKLMKNISQLESVYFSTRSNIHISNNDVTTCANKELLKDRANGYRPQKDEEKNKPIDCLGAFFSGFCKYAHYNKFEVRGLLRNGDFHNSVNVICSLSFDQDQDYFATAGVSKKIKIYEFDALFNDAVNIHYPVIEMSNKSRLSSICWNSYIRNYLASTDSDGIVKAAASYRD
ncbi:Long chain acyl-CoA synthetase 5 [Camellia lanceoleosa]|uniref:Long chain acyl-CoA synthetase 5 n=1 Tax=Camellia lanceoleosa TaxID=1840588 RepID=A0ACC0FWI9_9ERIC|nr:Long chain acyl-CoA synthetase 5 [Camellia lanceoleosa]